MKAIIVKIRTIVFDLLATNEMEKLSDDALLQKLVGLVSEKDAANILARSLPISAYRSQYNSGRLGKKPEVNSFRYVDGIAVNNHNTPLSFQKKCILAKKHGIVDRRLIEEARCQQSTAP